MRDSAYAYRANASPYQSMQRRARTKPSIKRGKIAVLTGEEARQLLEFIDANTMIGLRDRALIATMVSSCSRHVLAGR